MHILHRDNYDDMECFCCKDRSMHELVDVLGRTVCEYCASTALDTMCEYRARPPVWIVYKKYYPHPCALFATRGEAERHVARAHANIQCFGGEVPHFIIEEVPFWDQERGPLW